MTVRKIRARSTSLCEYNCNQSERPELLVLIYYFLLLLFHNATSSLDMIYDILYITLMSTKEKHIHYLLLMLLLLL